MPTAPQMPRSVIGFLREHVDHVEKLRFIVFLHESPGAMTYVQTAARTLDIPKSQIRGMANELADDGLVRVSAEILELAPTSIDDRLAIADLAEWYAQDRALILDVLRALGRLAS